MSYRAGRDNEPKREQSTGRDGVSLAGWVALGLAAVFGTLNLAEGLPVDLRWCAVLASACLNVFVVAIWGPLAMHAQLAQTERLSWRQTARALWHIIRRHPDATGWGAIARSIRWEPWGVPVCACLSAALAAAAFRPFAPAALIRAMVSPSFVIAAGAAALILAFFTLVAERFYAHDADRSHASESASLAGMLRVVLLCALTAAVSAGWFVYLHTALDLAVHAIALFSAAIAIELAIRAGLRWFSAPRAGAIAVHVPSSILAGLLRYRRSPLSSLGAELHTRYGIDLRQNWVLRSFVRLLPATIAAIAVCAWLLTSIVVLNPGQRAVYERFGAPVAVWSPGLHAGMPWPFGKVRVVDNGAVHQLIVSGGADSSSIAAPSTSADGPTPADLNRLWDVLHPWETTQVIAGASGDQQNFQIVNADVRLDYRVALSDAAARAALYRSVDPASTVRSIANREVVHYLASHTLQSLLETSQTAMADSVRQAVQLQLDRLESGIEVVAVVIESVHPPAGAAAAYHDVQAAQIRAQGSVAQARGFAAGVLGNAQQQALASVAQASARAGDTLSSARVQQINFDADKVAYRLGGPAFAFEYYLSKLQKGLQNARITVIDNRIVDDRRATIDLRPFTAGDLAGIRPGN
ncbi:regulator of protease activity HflC (stomatin/prohibitin superfamily) [Paraburkholderia sp. BL23I1N1]|uniref:protease modulator HflK n=1 Tax=Paraburkholderia sp. BL23I1N1 TaxID=1938802 RepID=UPI000E70F2BD|nr:protease modulator HflK [Paraburkholderia sp. BL23I1N1]RKE39234.1 regulator of protease activity HflC (stomatin/prohibitin superfamily) [Paraburkholderia sp. BL23I1N1]